MDFPLGEFSPYILRRKQIAELLALETLSVNEIANAVGCTRVTVNRIKSQLAKTANNPMEDQR